MAAERIDWGNRNQLGLRFYSVLRFSSFIRISSVPEFRCMTEGIHVKERHPNVAGVGRHGGRADTDLCFGMSCMNQSQLELHSSPCSLHTARCGFQLLGELLLGEKYDLLLSVQRHPTKRVTTVLCRPQKENTD